MSGYPKSAVLFLLVLTLLAAAGGGLLLHSGNPASLNPAALAVWCLLGILSESLSVYISRGNLYVSSVEMVILASYLTEGPLTALTVIILTFLLRIQNTGVVVRHLFNTPFRLTLFNIAHHIVVLAAVDRIFSLLGRITGGLTVVPALISAPFLFLFSCILNALFYRFEEGRPFRRYFIETFGSTFTDALPAGFAAVMIAVVYPRFGLVSVLFFLIPLAVTRLAFLDNEGA